MREETKTEIIKKCILKKAPLRRDLTPVFLSKCTVRKISQTPGNICRVSIVSGEGPKGEKKGDTLLLSDDELVTYSEVLER